MPKNTTKAPETTRKRFPEKKMASLTPALVVYGCGCFLPDLTRFTTLRCGGTRRGEYYHSPPPSAGIGAFSAVFMKGVRSPYRRSQPHGTHGQDKQKSRTGQFGFHSCHSTWIVG